MKVKKDTVVFSFGRWNPLTIGHGTVADIVSSTAQEYNADSIIFLSQVQNKVSDPLEWQFKVRACKAAFPNIKFSTQIEIKTPFQALQFLSTTYKHIICVVGSDRLDDFTERMTPYAEKWGIEKFSVISAGIRLETGSDVESARGTKKRNFAKLNDKKSFYKNLPIKLSDKMKLTVFTQTKRGLKIV